MQTYHVRMTLGSSSVTALETVEAHNAADAAERAIRLAESKYGQDVLDAHARVAS